MTLIFKKRFLDFEDINYFTIEVSEEINNEDFKRFIHTNFRIRGIKTLGVKVIVSYISQLSQYEIYYFYTTCNQILPTQLIYHRFYPEILDKEYAVFLIKSKQFTYLIVFKSGQIYLIKQVADEFTNLDFIVKKYNIALKDIINISYEQLYEKSDEFNKYFKEKIEKQVYFTLDKKYFLKLYVAYIVVVISIFGWYKLDYQMNYLQSQELKLNQQINTLKAIEASNTKEFISRKIILLAQKLNESNLTIEFITKNKTGIVFGGRCQNADALNKFFKNTEFKLSKSNIIGNNEIEFVAKF